MSVFVPPTVTKELNSITTTMAATIKMECAAKGHPQPEIVWYRNGQQIKSNSVTVVDGGLLKIHSVDPRDEGIYQCFAKSEFGQSFTAAYLTVRTSDVHMKLPKLYGIKCYPINYASVLVTFRATEPVDMITYYLKGEEPHAWNAIPPIRTNLRKFVISDHMDPLREYTLHLRGLMKAATEPSMRMKQESMLITSRLSKGVKCQTQGMDVLSTAFPDHIFIWWPKAANGNTRKSNYSLAVDHFLVQLWNNETLNNPDLFSSEVIGTTSTVDEYKTWDEIEKLLVKIPAKANFINSTYALDSPPNFVVSEELPRKKALRPTSRMHLNVTEIRVAGHVTGLLIPNTKRVLARVIGVKAGEVVMDEELKYVQWREVREVFNLIVG